jgi:hypothetical protein
MAANEPGVSREPEGTTVERETEAKRPAVYRVARSTSDREALNTIDIYGEKPFSV